MIEHEAQDVGLRVNGEIDPVQRSHELIEQQIPVIENDIESGGLPSGMEIAGKWWEWGELYRYISQSEPGKVLASEYRWAPYAGKLPQAHHAILLNEADVKSMPHHGENAKIIARIANWQRRHAAMTNGQASVIFDADFQIKMLTELTHDLPEAVVGDVLAPIKGKDDDFVEFMVFTKQFRELFGDDPTVLGAVLRMMNKLDVLGSAEQELEHSPEQKRAIIEAYAEQSQDNDGHDRYHEAQSHLVAMSSTDKLRATWHDIVEMIGYFQTGVAAYRLATNYRAFETIGAHNPEVDSLRSNGYDPELHEALAISVIGYNYTPKFIELTAVFPYLRSLLWHHKDLITSVHELPRERIKAFTKKGVYQGSEQDRLKTAAEMTRREEVLPMRQHNWHQWLRGQESNPDNQPTLF